RPIHSPRTGGTVVVPAGLVVSTVRHIPELLSYLSRNGWVVSSGRACTRGRLPCCRPSRTGSHSRGIRSAVSRSLPACFLLLVGCRYPVRSLGCSSLVELGVGGRRAPPPQGRAALRRSQPEPVGRVAPLPGITREPVPGESSPCDS